LLRDLNSWYINHAEKLGIMSKVFFETRPTFGQTIVDESSASLFVKGVSPIAIDANHIGICKPLSRESLVYKVTRDFVDEMFPPRANGEGMKRQPSITKELPTPPANTGNPRLRDLFLLGCGVGNHIAMLPLPGTSPDDRSLDEFLAAAARLKVDQDGVLAGLRKVKEELALQPSGQQPNSEIKAVIEQYFDLMERIPDMARSVSSEQDYRFFQLGMLLYRIATWAVVTPSSDDRGILAHALDGLSEKIELPSGAKAKLAEYVKAAKTRRRKDLLTPANEFARIVYAYL
jgi:hypothetical protein